MTDLLAKSLAGIKSRDDVKQGDFLTADVEFHLASKKEMARVAKALGDEVPEGYIAGWASTPEVDHAGHRVMTGAFSQSIREKGLSGPRGVKLLAYHDWRQITGSIKVLEYRGDRLWLEAQINTAISYAKDLYEVIKTVEGLNFSVGFFLQDYRWIEEGDFEVLQIDRGDLIEVSVVPLPMNDGATMEFFKSREIGSVSTIAEFEKALIAKGLAKTRNEARSITLAVKSCAHVFLKGREGDQVSNPAPSQPAPGLAPEKLDKLLAAITELKQLAAPAAGK